MRRVRRREEVCRRVRPVHDQPSARRDRRNPGLADRHLDSRRPCARVAVDALHEVDGSLGRQEVEDAGRDPRHRPSRRRAISPTQLDVKLRGWHRSVMSLGEGHDRNPLALRAAQRRAYEQRHHTKGRRRSAGAGPRRREVGRAARSDVPASALVCDPIRFHVGVDPHVTGRVGANTGERDLGAKASAHTLLLVARDAATDASLAATCAPALPMRLGDVIRRPLRRRQQQDESQRPLSQHGLRRPKSVHGHIHRRRTGGRMSDRTGRAPPSRWASHPPAATTRREMDGGRVGTRRGRRGQYEDGHGSHKTRRESEAVWTPRRCAFLLHRQPPQEPRTSASFPGHFGPDRRPVAILPARIRLVKNQACGGGTGPGTAVALPTCATRARGQLLPKRKLKPAVQRDAAHRTRFQLLAPKMGSVERRVARTRLPEAAMNRNRSRSYGFARRVTGHAAGPDVRNGKIGVVTWAFASPCHSALVQRTSAGPRTVVREPTDDERCDDRQADTARARVSCDHGPEYPAVRLRGLHRVCPPRRRMSTTAQPRFRTAARRTSCVACVARRRSLGNWSAALPQLDVGLTPCFSTCCRRSPVTESLSKRHFSTSGSRTTE